MTYGAHMANQWLMKSEPDTFSIADLERVKVEPWSGVRSYFARIHMRAMSVGDQVLPSGRVIATCSSTNMRSGLMPRSSAAP